MTTRATVNGMFNVLEGLKKPDFIFVEVLLNVGGTYDLCVVNHANKREVLHVLWGNCPSKDKEYLEALALIGNEYAWELMHHA